jgi:hypothetical protein
MLAETNFNCISMDFRREATGDHQKWEGENISSGEARCHENERENEGVPAPIPDESSGVYPEVTPCEFLVVCPVCKTIENIQYSGGRFLTGRKFFEKDNAIFHNCGLISQYRIFSQDPVSI